MNATFAFHCHRDGLIIDNSNRWCSSRINAQHDGKAKDERRRGAGIRRDSKLISAHFLQLFMYKTNNLCKCSKDTERSLNAGVNRLAFISPKVSRKTQGIFLESACGDKRRTEMHVSPGMLPAANVQWVNSSRVDVGPIKTFFSLMAYVTCFYVSREAEMAMYFDASAWWIHLSDSF